MRLLTLIAAFSVFAAATQSFAGDKKFEFLGVGAQSTKENAVASLKKREADGLIKTEKSWQGKSAAEQCRSSKKDACVAWDFSVGGILISYLSVDFDGGKVSTLFADLSRYNYDLLLKLLVEKYGPPSSSIVNEYVNGFGAKFSGRVVSWLFSDGDLSFSEITEGKKDRSTLYFESLDYYMREKEKRQKNIEKAKKAL